MKIRNKYYKYVEKTYEHSTDNEKLFISALIILLTVLFVVFSYKISTILGIILTVYNVTAIFLAIFDASSNDYIYQRFSENNKELIFIYLSPFALNLAIFGYFYSIIMPYRGKDIKKLRKSKLKKLKRWRL